MARSPLGFHVISVSDKVAPSFEDVRDDYVSLTQQNRVKELEDAFIDSLFAAGDPEYTAGAVRLVQHLAASPRLHRLAAAERSATLATYRGGELTVGEWADFVISSDPRVRRLFAGSDSAQVAEGLRMLVHNELLTQAAYDAGYEISSSLADTLALAAKRDLRTAAAAGKLRSLNVSERESIDTTVDQAIHLMTRTQRGAQALNRVWPILRTAPGIDIRPYRFPAVMARFDELRQQDTEDDRSESGS